MPQIHVNLSEALDACPATLGMGPLALSAQIESCLLPTASHKIEIKLSTNFTMEFLVHTKNNKTILSSMDSLASNCEDGVAAELLPEILIKLAEQNIKFTALQFPHAFMVKGRFSGTSYRAHFNHILLYKDHKNTLNAVLIDSTKNPIGVYNPIPILGWLASSSLLSGEELLQTKLARLIQQKGVKNSLQNLCDLPVDILINIRPPILTYEQPTLNDKRCGIYTLNAMAELANHILSEDKITHESISETITTAHQALNTPKMFALSYPEEKKKNSMGPNK